MYGISKLKRHIYCTDILVECPVKGCSVKVERQRQHFIREERYKCPVHSIYISPSTFEYETEFDNMLWTDDSDKDRFKRIKTVKRESRIARENSEDAVTWNVFRFLERNNLMSGYLFDLTGQDPGKPELVLWSFSPSQNGSYDLLDKARAEFGELPNRGSEPDIIMVTDKALFFIEAKVLAGNDTSGHGQTLQRHLNEPKRYVSGGGKWFARVFKSDYRTVIMDQKYELMRFWLLGTWMADQHGLPFYLVNLVLKEREPGIEQEFGRHIMETGDRKFNRTCWENIYEFVVKAGISNEETAKFIEYFENKALGYNPEGELIKAFDV